MAAMTVLVKPISESLALSPFEMGTILGAWQFVYLVAAIPTGAILDRFGDIAIALQPSTVCIKRNRIVNLFPKRYTRIGAKQHQGSTGLAAVFAGVPWR